VTNPVSPELTSRVLDYIAAHEEEILEDLKALSRIPSVRGEAEPGFPFGKMPAAAVEAAADLYEKHGFALTRKIDKGYALANVGPTGRTLGVFCHCDVVPANTGVWEQVDNAFEPEIKDGYLIGRGVKDNKSAVIGVLHAMEALKAAGVPVRHNIQVFLGANEESGMEDIKNFRAENPLPDLSLVPDCEAPLCRGEKGAAHIELLCGKKFERILDFSGGSKAGVCGGVTVVLPNEAALREELLAALKGHTDAQLSENDNGQLLLTTKGISAHPAMPVGSVNGGWIAAEVLLKCPSLGEHDLAILEQVRAILCNIKPLYFGIDSWDEAFRDLTMVCTVITVENGQLKLTCVCSFQPAFPVETIHGNIAAKCAEIGWTPNFLRHSTGFLICEDDPTIELVVDTYRQLCKARDISKIYNVYTSNGGTYARALENAFTIGTDVPITRPPQWFSAGHGRVHQPDECINVQYFLEGILHLAMILEAVDRELDHLPSVYD